MGGSPARYPDLNSSGGLRCPSYYDSAATRKYLGDILLCPSSYGSYLLGLKIDMTSPYWDNQRRAELLIHLPGGHDVADLWRVDPRSVYGV